MRDVGHYETQVVKVGPDASLVDVADRMDLYAVGCVLVVDDAGGPLGIVTDRDLLRRAVATGRDPEKTTASEVMTDDLVTGTTDEPLQEVLGRMRARAVRRLPILRKGRLVGLVALDDVVAELGRELGDLRETVRSEVLGARRAAPRRRRREELESTLEELRTELSDLGDQSAEWIQQAVESLRKRLGGGGS